MLSLGPVDMAEVVSAFTLADWPLDFPDRPDGGGVGVGASAAVFSLADLPSDFLTDRLDGGGVGLGASAADGAGVGGDDASLAFTWGAPAAATSPLFAVRMVVAAALSVLRGCSAV